MFGKNVLRLGRSYSWCCSAFLCPNSSLVCLLHLLFVSGCRCGQARRQILVAAVALLTGSPVVQMLLCFPVVFCCRISADL